MLYCSDGTDPSASLASDYTVLRFGYNWLSANNCEYVMLAMANAVSAAVTTFKVHAGKPCYFASRYPHVCLGVVLSHPVRPSALLGLAQLPFALFSLLLR